MMLRASEYHLIKRANKTPVDQGWPRLTPQQYNEHRALAGEVGLVCGDAQGLYVLDVDIDKATGQIAEETLTALLALELPETLKTNTPSGGCHYWFQTDEKLPRRIRIAPGIDFLGVGGYVALYEPLAQYEPDMINGLPHSLRELLVAAVEDKPISFLPGGRNNAIASLAGSLLKQGVPLQQAHDELQAFNASATNPMQPAEVAHTVASIARYHPEPEPVPAIGAWGETLAEIEGLALPPIVSAIGPLMLATTTTLHGQSGAGKSLFAEWLAVRMAEGSRMGDWRCIRPLRVLYLDQENPSGYVQQRFAGLQALAGTNLRVIHRDYLRRKGFRFNLSIKEHQQILIDQQFDFLILDSLAAVAPGTEGLPMTSAEWFEQLMEMSDSITSSGRGILMMGNLNRNGTMFGTAAQEWRADRNWSAEKWEGSSVPESATAAFHLDGSKERGLDNMSVKGKWYFDREKGWIQEDVWKTA